MGGSIVEFDDVSKAFDDNVVLHSVNLNIEEGSVLGLVGRSGSGKTTLFRLFLGIYKPTSGSILFRGSKLTQKSRKLVGFASQESSFYPRLTVEENLEYFGGLYNLSNSFIKDKTKELLELFDLEHARKLKSGVLSGGMKRRLDLAIALIHDPDLLILDEPTAGLDVILKDSIWDLILKIKKMNKTIIISSHNLEEIDTYCNQIAFVTHNTILGWDKVKKLKGKMGLEKLFRRLCNASSS